MIISGNACLIEVVAVMTVVAPHTGRTLAIRATRDTGDVQTSVVGLPWAVARWMAIHAARVLKHLTGLFEQSDRSCTTIRDAREARRQTSVSVDLVGGAWPFAPLHADIKPTAQVPSARMVKTRWPISDLYVSRPIGERHRESRRGYESKFRSGRYCRSWRDRCHSRSVF